MDIEKHLPVEKEGLFSKLEKSYLARKLSFAVGRVEFLGLVCAGLLSQIPWYFVKISGRSKLSTLVVGFVIWCSVFALLTLSFRGMGRLRSIPTIAVISIAGSLLTTLISYSRTAKDLSDFIDEVNILLMMEVLILPLNLLCIFLGVSIARIVAKSKMPRDFE